MSTSFPIVPSPTPLLKAAHARLLRRNALLEAGTRKLEAQLEGLQERCDELTQRLRAAESRALFFQARCRQAESTP